MSRNFAQFSVDEKAVTRSRYNRISHPAPDIRQEMSTNNEPAHEIMALIIKATSECSGEPARPRSRTIAFAVRTPKVWK